MKEVYSSMFAIKSPYELEHCFWPPPLFTLKVPCYIFFLIGNNEVLLENDNFVCVKYEQESQVITKVPCYMESIFYRMRIELMVLWAVCISRKISC